MKIQCKTRLVRFGTARKLTRAMHEGDFVELNPVKFWIMPPA